MENQEQGTSVVKGKIIANYVNEIFPTEDFGDKYKVKKIIGKGSYGYVAKAVRKSTNSYVAIKKIIKLFESGPETRRILREIVLLKNCKHPNIVSMIEVILPKDQTPQNFDKIYLVTEFCDSDLQKVFKSDNIFFQLDDVKYITYQLLCGLKYLHSANIIHRDLKPANVLINGHGLTIKICDFGLARVIEDLQIPKQLQESSDDDKQENQILQNAQKAKRQPAKQQPPAEQKKKKGLVRSNTKRIQVKKQEESGISQQSKMKRTEAISSPMAKLTLRVTTRWYRAPQIILLQKGYHKPIDMWSVGCIFGELLKMQKKVCADALHRFPLFPGKYCYPVSPNTLGVVYKNGYPQGRNDQLAMILSTIGKPTEQQMSFLSDQNAKEYLKRLQNRQRKSFQEMFPQMQVQAVKLLDGSLKFNPRNRLSVEQALNDPFFTEYRRKDLQSTREPITMEFQGNEQNLTIEKLRFHFKKQILQYIQK